MTIQNIFFDLDGTLINSEPGLLNAHRDTLKKFGYRKGLEIVAEEGLAWTIGPPLGLTVPRLIGSKDPLRVQEYIATFQNLYQEKYYCDLILYEGVPELLEELKRRSKRLFVCTSKPEPIAQKVMAYLKLDRLLTGLLGAHMDERPHDKSDLLQELCAKHNCKSRESAMVGDRHFDMQAGRQQEFAICIGVNYGFGTEEELRGSGASHIVSQALDILELDLKLDLAK